MDSKIGQVKKNSTNIFLNKYFNLILSFFVVLALFLSYFLFIGPKFQNTKSIIQDNIANQKFFYAQQKKKHNSLKAIAKAYSEIPGADLQKFNAVLPPNYQQERLFGEFEEIVSKGGWLLTSVEISDAEDEKSSEPSVVSSMAGSSSEKVQELQITLLIQAIDYAGMKNLLKLFENNLRLFDVISIDFSGESAEIVLNTYYYGDAPQELETPVQ